MVFTNLSYWISYFFPDLQWLWGRDWLEGARITLTTRAFRISWGEYCLRDCLGTLALASVFYARIVSIWLFSGSLCVFTNVLVHCNRAPGVQSPWQGFGRDPFT